MDLKTFKDTLKHAEAPEGLSNLLTALWLVEKGMWHEAHRIIQDDNSIDGAWVHAYLHRVEGDEGNASYWYGRAGRIKPDISLSSEWNEIVKALL